MPSEAPDPDAFAIPSVDELDAMREAYGLSRAEFSRQAGRDDAGAWSEIVREGIDPRTSTIRAFLDVLHEAVPNDRHAARGRPLNVEVSSEGGER